MWPAMLWGAGVELPLRVYSHGYINVGGEKMSKSRGIFVRPLSLVDSLQPASASARKIGSDGARYTLMREVPFDRDGDFDLPAFVDRYNADLANDFGNLASRTLKMLAQYTGGVIPAGEPEGGELESIVAELPSRLDARMDGLDFSGALVDIWRLVDRANKYVDESKPWELKKSPESAGRLDAVLYNLAESLRVLVYLTYPYVPDAAAELARQLRVTHPREVGPGGEDLHAVLAWGGLQPGHQTEVGEVLFPRLDKAVVLAGE
jgi:methionyl-tRNA synthetase